MINGHKGAGLEVMKVKTVEILENGKEVEKEDDQQPIDKKKVRKILSQEDAAAVLIQSAYKGFEVRRSQPLEKLRKVHQIRQQTEVVKNQIQMFESSSTNQDSKRKVAASETIMNLLLQLDTIQGLRQSVGDLRKSVARELTILREKLDWLGSPVVVGHEKMKLKHPSHTVSDCGATSATDPSVTIYLVPENVITIS